MERARCYVASGAKSKASEGFKAALKSGSREEALNGLADLALQEQQCTRPELWALACSALLIKANGQRHDVLCCAAATPKQVEQSKQALREWWNVKSRADLLSTLQWLEKSGHRAKFHIFLAM